jgi:hypothetical protein
MAASGASRGTVPKRRVVARSQALGVELEDRAARDLRGGQRLKIMVHPGADRGAGLALPAAGHRKLKADQIVVQRRQGRQDPEAVLLVADEAQGAVERLPHEPEGDARERNDQDADNEGKAGGHRQIRKEGHGGVGNSDSANRLRRTSPA